MASKEEDDSTKTNTLSIQESDDDIYMMKGKKIESLLTVF